MYINREFHIATPIAVRAMKCTLTGIADTRPTENLYNTNIGTGKYNGSISCITWNAGTESTVRGYKFTYDGLDRMLNANYGETASINTNANRFSENVTAYDKNGNIKTLQRYGQLSASTYGLLDNLTYLLAGNQLNRMDDAATTSAYARRSECSLHPLPLNIRISSTKREAELKIVF